MRSGFKLGTFLALCVAAAMASCGSDEPAAASCNNNGVAEPGEACDGLDLKGQTCANFGMGTATSPISCDQTCNLVLAQCGGGGGAAGTMQP